LVTADYAALYRSLGLDGKPAQQALAQMSTLAPPSGIEGLGSNNWVVAGSHSETGMPLLANDPHLKLSAPALWYFARLEAPGLEVAGATMPGLPVIVLGQNAHIAWGYTNTETDVQDLYLERIKPGDAAQYQTPEGWARFDSHEEIIKVKGGADVKITVRSTRHGPVISDAGDVAKGLTGSRGPADKPAYALAMRWTALDPEVGTIEASMAFNQAKSVAEFVAASAQYVAPMQNMVVADDAGHIAEVSAGRVPLRSADNELKGYVPAPGWDARYDWTGFLEPQLTPRELDPPRGWIATANQRIHAPDYPYFLTSEWTLPYRHQRIEQLLAAQPKHSLASLAAIQADVKSLATERLLPYLRAAKAEHPLAAAAQRELAGFDGTMAGDKAAPAIFYAWWRHLGELILADKLGQDLFEAEFNRRGFRTGLEGILERNDAWWCTAKDQAPAADACARRSGEALKLALDELQAKLGPDVTAWRWDALHVARAEHRPFSHVKALAGLFELREPVGGDTYTINVSRVNLKADATTGEFYLAEHGPSLRALYDLKDRGASRFMHSSGQSGLPFSPWYREFLKPWGQVGYVPLWGQGMAHQLSLQPAP
ncbi:MAG TPA: penicillin acylase family protein, partial [Methylibium sp.]